MIGLASDKNLVFKPGLLRLVSGWAATKGGDPVDVYHNLDRQIHQLVYTSCGGWFSKVKLSFRCALYLVCVRFIRWGFGQSIGSELMIAMMLMTMVANTWDRRDTCHTPSLHNAPSDKVSHLRSPSSSEACALTYLSLSPYLGKMICFSLPKLICEIPSNGLWKLCCREIFCP